VCNNQYRFIAKLFKGLARSGKNLNGWFWGFKLHLIINRPLSKLKKTGKLVKTTKGENDEVDKFTRLTGVQIS
jgi:hypothetical protein